MNSARVCVIVGVVAVLVFSTAAFSARADSINDQFGLFAATLSLGEPCTVGNVTFFPIQTDFPSSLPVIVPLKKGIEQGEFTLQEIGEGYPDAVAVFSRHRQYYGFGMGGAVYGGGRQGRGAASDYMWRGGQGYTPYGGGYGFGGAYQGRRSYFSPQRGELSRERLRAPEIEWDGRRVSGLAVPVVCVDRDRWSENWAQMSETGLADTATRRAIIAGAPQTDVWRQVFMTRNKLGIHAEGSKSYNDILADQDIAQTIHYTAAVVPPTPAFSPHTVGVLVMAGGRIRGLDLFGTHQLFTDCWPELVQGYALDGLLARTRGTADARKALVFLERVVHSPIQFRPGIALGDNITVRSQGIVGAGLSFEGQLVHLAAFPMR